MASASETTIRIYSTVATPFSGQVVLEAWSAAVAFANQDMPGVLPDKVDAEVHESINGRRFIPVTVRLELEAHILADAADPSVQAAIFIAASTMMIKLSNDRRTPTVVIVLDGYSESGDPGNKLAWAGILFVAGFALLLYELRILSIIVGTVALWWFGWIFINLLFAQTIHLEHNITIVTIHWPPSSLPILLFIFWVLLVIVLAALAVVASRGKMPRLS